MYFFFVFFNKELFNWITYNWQLDVGVSKLNFTQIWSDLVQRLRMRVKTVDFSFISYDTMQINTAELYTQTPNYFLLAERKLES